MTDNTIIECSTKDAIRMIDVIVRAGNVPMLWGGYGTGKSSIVAQYAEARECQLIDTRALHYDSVDVRGFPYRGTDNKAEYAIPAWLPDGSKPTIHIIDEITSAPSMVQASFYQYALDGKLADYVKPDNVHVIFAGNRQSDRGVYNAMPHPLCNRLVHLHIKADPDAWLDWAGRNEIDPIVMAFIRLRRDDLHVVNDRSKDPAQTTPRSLKFASDLIKQGIPKDLELTLLSGAIGRGTATELIAMMRIFENMIDPQSIITDPQTAQLPSDLATKYAISTCLASMADSQNFENIYQYACRLDREYLVLIMSDSIKRKPELTSTQAYVDYASKHNVT